MAGFYVIYVTPGIDTALLRDEGWDAQFDTGETVVKNRDRFELADTEPDAEYPVDPGEWVAEARDVSYIEGDEPVEQWRVRIRGPQTVPRLAGGVIPLYTLNDPLLPAGWGNAARYWGVHTSAANHKLLHDHIYTTLNYGPVAGAWAALDPDNGTQFLPSAVRNFLEITGAQFLTRLTITANQLELLGYTPTELRAIVAAPAGKTEDDAIRALVHDMGFTMAQLRNAGIRTD